MLPDFNSRRESWFELVGLNVDNKFCVPLCNLCLYSDDSIVDLIERFEILTDLLPPPKES